MLKYIFKKLENSEYPLLGPNITALKFWGLILPKELLTKCLYIFFHLTVIIFTATEYAEIWFVKYDMNLLLTNIKITLLATVSVSKVTSFLINQDKWLNIINYVNKADKVQRNGDDAKRDIINRYTKYSRKITYFYIILMYTTVVIVMSQPIYKYLFSESYRENVRNGTENYAQVVSSWVPFDKNTVTGHIFACLYQSYAAIYGGGWITSFDTNAIVIMVFFRGELEMLRIDSRNLFGSENLLVSKEEFKKRLKNCYQRHVDLLKYSYLFDSCLSPIMFLYVIVCSVMLCATAYQITTIETSTTQRFLTAEYLIFGIAQLFMYCWHSNDVLYVSKDLSLGPYESVWWSRDVSEQKDVNILVDQFKKIIVFSAGPFTNITVTTFISILKGAYSYYTLLSQSQQY
ncbi:odorant receptor Or2-like [Melitaea cinxia]|uniref:odorant receptor Or2-like n=1 Tax=Melitaea cinxia TaxID=113334 RepID=UPI001E271507|nr:odorant receptor Or2-like [Melitaea cinxia]